MWQSLEILNVFNTLIYFSILFKKLEHCFLVESTKIDNLVFPNKAALSEASVKTNSVGSTKWTYHKKRSFASNYFLFLKMLFQFKNPVQRVDLLYQLPKYPYSYFSKALEFYLRMVFPCEEKLTWLFRKHKEKPKNGRK